MSEEIIIDDVNVAECRYFWANTDTKCHMGLNYTDCFECSKLSNCYFKQLKRLQAENERLNSTRLQLQSSELKQHLEKVNYERENFKLRKALKEIREDLEQDTTCESRECGCDDYEECLKCIKETILDKISEVLKRTIKKSKNSKN